MKFDTIKNPNYVATVVRVEEGDLYPVAGLDNLVGYSKFGMQALVSKDTQPGLYILFSTEVQLSEEYAKANSLFREATLNADQEVTGYLEQNRRVKAIKLKGNRSESLLMPLDSLRYLGLQREFDTLVEGDVFDSIDGHEICRKYVVKEPKPQAGNQPKARIRRVDAKVFPEHIDSENYFRNAHKIPDDAHVIITQKLHGTSVRYGNVPALVDEQKWWERLLRRPRRTAHRFVVGSRRTVKSVDLSAEGQNQNHYYSDGDLWTRYADEHKLADRIPKDHIVYGELVGFTPDGAAIQKNYTYDCADGEAELYVYRVAVVTSDGLIVDYSDEQMRQFCQERGLKAVPLFQFGSHWEVSPSEWLETRYYDDWMREPSPYVDRPIPLSGDKKLVDEGICIRYDGPHGVFILKAKSPTFLAHETKMLDTGADDLEAAA
jgi:hypothetical protein